MHKWDEIDCPACGSADVDLAEAIPGPLFACQECGHAFDPEDESTWERVERVWTPDERPRHYVCRYKDVTIVIPAEEGIENVGDARTAFMEHCNLGADVKHLVECEEVADPEDELDDLAIAPVLVAPRKPACPLVGIDGNAFSVIARVKRCLHEDGQPERAQEWVADAASSRSYDEVLQKTFRYVDPL